MVAEEQKEFLTVKKDSELKDFKERVGWIGIIFIIGLFAFQYYVVYDSRLVPNTVVVNVTDAATGKVHQETQVLYQPNSLVPNTDVSNMEWILLAGYSLGVIIFLVQTRKKARLLREDEVVEIVDKMMKYKRIQLNLPMKSWQIGPSAKLRYQGKVGEFEMMPWEWLVAVEVVTSLDVHRHFVVAIHPYEGYLMYHLKKDTDLSIIDVCPQCGEHFDIKYVPETEMRRMFDMMKGMKGVSQGGPK